MPCQVSWQFVLIKLQPSVHALGAEAAVAAEAPVGTASAARASTAQQTPAAARITAAKMPSFAMRASLTQQWTIVGGQSWSARQSRRNTQYAREFRCEWRPSHSHLKSNRFGGDSYYGATADESQFRVFGK